MRSLDEDERSIRPSYCKTNENVGNCVLEHFSRYGTRPGSILCASKYLEHQTICDCTEFTDCHVYTTQAVCETTTEENTGNVSTWEQRDEMRAGYCNVNANAGERDGTKLYAICKTNRIS